MRRENKRFLKPEAKLVFLVMKSLSFIRLMDWVETCFLAGRKVQKLQSLYWRKGKKISSPYENIGYTVFFVLYNACRSTDFVVSIWTSVRSYKFRSFWLSWSDLHNVLYLDKLWMNSKVCLRYLLSNNLMHFEFLLCKAIGGL